MKLKLKLDPNSLKQGLLEHVEKVVFGVVVLCFLGFVYQAIGRGRGVDFNPTELANEASKAEKHVKEFEPQSPAIRDFGKDADGIHKPVGTKWLDHKVLWRPPLFEIVKPRGMPKLFPLAKLRAAGGHGGFAMVQGMEAGMDAGMQTVKGQRWVVITGVFDYRKQVEAYQTAFQDAYPRDPTRDFPVYTYFRVQRAEVDPRDEGSQPKWESVNVIEMVNLTYNWGPTGQGQELVDERYFPPPAKVPFVFSLGPLVNRPWGPEVGHPDIPFHVFGVEGTGAYGDLGARDRQAKEGKDKGESAEGTKGDEKTGAADKEKKTQRPRRPARPVQADEPDDPDAPATMGMEGSADMPGGYGGMVPRTGMSGSSGPPMMGGMSGSMRPPMMGGMSGSMRPPMMGGMSGPMRPPMMGGMSGPMRPPMTGAMPSGGSPDGPGFSGMGRMPGGAGDLHGEMEQEQVPEYLLFRFFDFNVEPGKHYQYRVNLLVFNPNYGIEARFLQQEDLGKKAHLEVGWSLQSPAATVPMDSRVVLAPAKANDRAANLLLVHLDMEDGSTAFEEFPAIRGQLLNFANRPFTPANTGMSPYGVPMAMTMVGSRDGVTDLTGAREEESKNIDYLTNAIVLDLAGGTPLPGKDRELLEPRNVLLVDAEGNLAVRNELDDLAEFRVLKPPEGETLRGTMVGGGNTDILMPTGSPDDSGKLPKTGRTKAKGPAGMYPGMPANYPGMPKGAGKAGAAKGPVGSSMSPMMSPMMGPKGPVGSQMGPMMPGMGDLDDGGKRGGRRRGS